MFKFRTFIIIFIITFIFKFDLFAANDSINLINNKTELQKVNELKRDIDDILNNKELFNANYGIYIKNLDSNEVLYQYNSEKNFIPASTNKLVLTYSALNLLGPNYKFSTSLYLDGIKKSNGDFEGNVIIRGLGDPSHSNYFKSNPISLLEEFALALDSLGIKNIKGNIIGDDRFFDNIYYAKGWMWDDFIYTFSSQINSLSINENKVDFILKASNSISKDPIVSIFPENKYIHLYNSIKSTDYNTVLYINPFRDFKSNDIYLSGNIPIDSLSKEEYKISVTIDNPTLFFLNLFKSTLENYKIQFKGALLNSRDLEVDYSYADLNLIKEIISPDLIEIISNINKVSNNFASDMILKTISKELTGIGNFEDGIEEIKKFLKRNKIDVDNISLNDGSGLSRYNLLSPIFQCKLLTLIYRDKYRDLFINSLAQPGKNGTLRNRLTGSKAEFRVFAKTGTMSNVSNICGYVITEDNQKLAFSLMFNGFTCPLPTIHSIQDLILMRLSGFSRKNN